MRELIKDKLNQSCKNHSSDNCCSHNTFLNIKNKVHTRQGPWLFPLYDINKQLKFYVTGIVFSLKLS